MNKIVEWFDEYEDTLMQIFAFGVSTALGVGLIALSFVI